MKTLQTLSVWLPAEAIKKTLRALCPEGFHEILFSRLLHHLNVDAHQVFKLF